MSKPPPPALQLQTGAHTRTDTQTAQTTAPVHPPTATAAAAAAAPVSGTSTPSSVAPTPATPTPNTPSSASMSTASTPSAREPHGGNAGPGPAPPPPSQGTQGTTTPAASATSTPGPAPSASSGNGTGNGNGQTGLAYPALHLTPLNGTFVPKQISLDASEGPGGRVKIGRQTNVKTAPNATNGYFDSKVLSRAHAEVWSEDGKVFIKDVKSSNGTFINGERLSPESAESDVFELHTDDIVEFGIDILTDDTKQIVHHKVAAKVHLVLNAEDAIASHREINNWYRSAGEQSLNRSRAPPRTVPAQTGLSFEHVLSRLQGELQKSRDTGANLTDVNSTLGQVHDTFSGGPAPPLPPGAGIPRGFSASRAGANAQQQQQQQQQHEAHAQSIAALQAQLNETQTSLQGHVGKIRELEGLLAEHDTIKREVGSLRAQMEEAQSSMSAIIRERDRSLAAASSSGASPKRGAGAGATTNGRESPLARMLEADEEEEDDDEDGDYLKGSDDSDGEDEAADEDDDADAQSVASVETVTSASKRDRTNGTEARAPLAPLDADEDSANAPTSSPPPPPPSATPAMVDASSAALLASSSERERLLEEQNSKLVARLEALSLELNEATQLGAALRSQHAEASQTIKALEDRVLALEQAVDARVAAAEGKVLQQAEERWTLWRDRFEQSWKEERLSWEGEREALRRLVKDWEERKRLEAEEAQSERSQRVRGAGAAGAGEGEEGEARGIEDEREGEEADSSGSEADEAAQGSTGAQTSSSAPGSSSSKKSRATRRRKRSSLTPVPPSIPGAAATNARLSKLARNVVDGSGAGGVASDSDSTIGDLGGERVGAGRYAGAGSDAARSEGKAGEHGGLPLSVAGAVVVLAVAVGYGAAMKLKE
ncbi:hypothetical protein JCM8202_002550 [Rhodotorula sphaerocarpa]